MHEPLVSIIIPTYNRAHLIGETLDSVLAQSYTIWECLVVDDGSTDHTEDVMAQYCSKDSRFQYHHRPKDRLPGGNAARNYGLELSKGEYIQWFDSDDLMHPKKIETQLNLILKEHKNFSVCQTEVFNADFTESRGLRKRKIFTDCALDDFIQAKITFLTQAPLFKKGFLEANNLRFEESLLRAQEFEFFVRVLEVSPDYCFTNEPLVMLRQHADRISTNYEKPKFIYSTFMASYRCYILLKEKPVQQATLKNLRLRMLKQIILGLKNRHMVLTRKLVMKYLLLTKSFTSLFYMLLGIVAYQMGKNGAYIIKKA